MAVFNDNLEREERRRMERTTMEAEQAQLDAELAAVKAAEDAAQPAPEEKKIDRSVRPKTVRPERAVLTKPEEPRLMKHVYKLNPTLDPKKIRIEKVAKGKVQYSCLSNPLIPGAYVGDKFYFNEKWIIYEQLKQMNLRDPETIRKIQEACSTPGKEEKPSEKPSEDCSESAKKRLFKKKEL